MRLHAIVHSPLEKTGAIDKWIKDKKYKLTTTEIYTQQLLPDVSEFDMLVVLGGPYHLVNPVDLSQFETEIHFIKQVMQNNKPLLGICLGAQLIGIALGALPLPSEQKEVGIYPVQLTNEGVQDPLFKQFGPEFNVLHWHNDMPGLAVQATLLAKSRGCSMQAFKYKDRTYGLQFHLETTPDILGNMIEFFENDLIPGKFIRSKEEMVLTNFAGLHEKLFKVLNYLEKFVAVSMPSF